MLFLWPSINPDGQNIVVNWYRENVGTPYEVSPLHELYQKYIGHDNNRDAYMLNVVESRVVARTWREWEPQIIYVQHQTAPFPTRIWLPPFAEPIATARAGAHVASGEHDRHDASRRRSSQRAGRRDAHGHRLRRLVSRLHRLHADAAEHQRVLDGDARSIAMRRRTSTRSTTSRATCATFARSRCTRARGPGGWWRLKDAVDYMVTASSRRSTTRAKYREELLYNRYQAGAQRDQALSQPSRRTPT